MPHKNPSFNDIQIEQWRTYDHILTDSLWLFDSRDKSGSHELTMQGAFVPQIATQIFLRYSKAGEIIFDPFLGSGTSAIEAIRQGRRLIGVDIRPGQIDAVRQKLPPEDLDHTIHLFAGDATHPHTYERAREAIATMDDGATQVQMVILHPPYWDILRFSDNPDDLSNAPTLEAFMDSLESVARYCYELLQPNRYIAVVIGDKYAKGRFYPLTAYCTIRMEQIGYIPKSHIVKNITGNEIAKGRQNNLWRYRALCSDWHVFGFESILVFKRPDVSPTPPTRPNAE